MNEADNGSEMFVPEVGALYEDLADWIEGWANSLGLCTTCHDPVIEEVYDCDWGGDLRRNCDQSVRMARTVLTAEGKVDHAEDLKRRIEELYTVADAYAQRLGAAEDHRRGRTRQIVAQYLEVFRDEDPYGGRLGRLCQGMQRIWTLRTDDQPPKTPEDFAEAIDAAEFEEDGTKRRAQAEVRRLARELVEHLRLLAAVERKRAQPRRVEDADQTKPAKRGKRGPARLPLSEAWRYLLVVQEWTGHRDRNRKLPTQDRYRKVQLAEKHGITPKELDAMLGWYAKHEEHGRFPQDPRTLSRDQLAKWFE